jgi:hypothetical protein
MHRNTGLDGRRMAGRPINLLRGLTPRRNVLSLLEFGKPVIVADETDERFVAGFFGSFTNGRELGFEEVEVDLGIDHVRQTGRANGHQVGS